MHPPPAPFIVGVPRSGTTLLRMMLDAHPLLAIPPETHLIQKVARDWNKGRHRPSKVVKVMKRSRYWDDFGIDPQDLRRRLDESEPLTLAAALRAFYETYAAGQGKPRWGEKTPGYLTRMEMIHQVLPEARFVQIVRDGRDVALSLAKAHFGPDSLAAAAQRWTDDIREGRRQAERLPHYLEVRYEDLVSQPEPVLRRICEFSELPWDGAVLAHHESSAARLAHVDRDLPGAGGAGIVPAAQRVALLSLSTQPPRPHRIGVWRREFSAADVAAVEAGAGDLLDELGYRN